MNILLWKTYIDAAQLAETRQTTDIADISNQSGKEGIRIAVATGSIIRIVQKNLVLLDIAEFVEATATSEDCSNGKPAPDVFLLAAKKLGVEPENCLVVEDAGNGLLGARRAGMTCAGFEGSELPSDTALAPVTFSDYRKVTVEDLRKWHLEQSVK